MSLASDKAKFQEEYHEALRGRLVQLTADWLEKVYVSNDAEDYRKAVAFLTETLGLKLEKKADPHAGLATVNITLVNGSLQLRAQDNVIEMEEVLPKLQATPAMKQALSINDDISDILDA